MKKTVLSTAATLLYVAILGRSAGAYELGEKWRSSSLPLTYRVNPAGAPAGFHTACQRAASTWGRPSGTRFYFSYLGTTTVHRSVQSDRVHAVYWQANGAGFDSNTLAVTWTWTQGSEMTHFDMVFNGSVRWSAAPRSYEWDIESVALHEFGHALGLDHSRRSGAVMLSRIPPGTRLRTLGSDDLGGLRALYGTGARAHAATAGLAAPVLASPLDATAARRPTFAWNPVEGATHYEFRLDWIEEGPVALEERFVASTSVTLPASLPASGAYRWWVRAWDGTVPGAWSQESFVFGPDAIGTPAPLAARAGASSGLVLAWTEVPGAPAYDLVLSLPGESGPVVRLFLVSGASFAAPGLRAGSAGTWAVRARIGERSGAWSARSDLCPEGAR